jgi:hypothetical protein
MKIIESFFGRGFGGSWPSEYVIGSGTPALPEALTTGEASTIEALSSSHRGPLSAVGPRGRNTSQFRIQARAIDLYKNGLTVFFDKVEESFPEVQEWLHAIEEEIGIPAGCVRASIFASPGEHRGLEPHYDGDAVIIAPLRGTKRVELANPSTPHAPSQYNPGYRLLAEDLSAAPDHIPSLGPENPKLVELEPGMALFMPAGCWHATEHLEESLSLPSASAGHASSTSHLRVCGASCCSSRRSARPRTGRGAATRKCARRQRSRSRARAARAARARRGAGAPRRSD